MLIYPLHHELGSANTWEIFLQDIQDKEQIAYLTNKVAKTLIIDLPIQQGFGMSLFLNTSSNLNNHEALHAWVKQTITHLADRQLYDEDSLYLLIKSALLKELPNDEVF